MPSLAINGKEKLSIYNQQLNAKRNKKLPLKRYGILSVCQPLVKMFLLSGFTKEEWRDLSRTFEHTSIT